MVVDNRKYQRFSPEGIKANITIIPPSPVPVIVLEGTVIDMSYRGIKIKLFSAMPADIPQSKIKINLILPDSNLPVTILGEIKYLNEQIECGLHYSNVDNEQQVDDLIFECMKRVSVSH